MARKLAEPMTNPVSANTLGSPAAMQPLKTLAPGARPPSESIVAPYRETVLRLAAEGEGHQRIHAVIRKEGVTGSANAVYQYLLKVRHENGLAGDDRSEDQPSDQAKGRPLRIGPYPEAAQADSTPIHHHLNTPPGWTANRAWSTTPSRL